MCCCGAIFQLTKPTAARRTLELKMIDLALCSRLVIQFPLLLSSHPCVSQVAEMNSEPCMDTNVIIQIQLCLGCGDAQGSGVSTPYVVRTHTFFRRQIVWMDDSFYSVTSLEWNRLSAWLSSARVRVFFFSHFSVEYWKWTSHLSLAALECNKFAVHDGKSYDWKRLKTVTASNWRSESDGGRAKPL